jgi:hypothetical protein
MSSSLPRIGGNPDQPTVRSGDKKSDVNAVSQRVGAVAGLLATIGRLSELLDELERGEGRRLLPATRIPGATADAQQSSKTRRDPIRLLIVSAAGSFAEFLAETRPLLEGARFEKAELVFAVAPELNRGLLEQACRFIGQRVLIEPLSSSAAVELRAGCNDAARPSRRRSALSRELAIFRSFYQPLGVSSLVRLHEAYALYREALGRPNS